MFQKPTKTNSKYGDEDFVNNLKSTRIGFYEISYDSYANEGDEGPFTILKKQNDIFPSIGSNEDFFSKSIISNLVLKKLKDTYDQNENEQIQFTNFKNHFLLYSSRNNSQTVDLKEMPQELKRYFEQNHLSLARICGFNLYNLDGDEIPCILTKRPINGPLSLYTNFLSIKSDSLDRSNLESSKVINNHFSSEIYDFSPEQKFILIIGIVAGIEFLHRLGKVHGHLNPDTVYLDKDFYPKICGYEFIQPKDLKNSDEESDVDIDKYEDDSDSDSSDDSDDDDESGDIFNSSKNIAFNAPEILSRKTTYQESDIYSIGMLIYYILLGKRPFESLKRKKKIRKICKGTLPFFPKSIKNNWKKIIKKCCEFNPENRQSSSDLLNYLVQKENRDDLVSSISYQDDDDDDSTNHKIRFSKKDKLYITKIIFHSSCTLDFHDSDIIKYMVTNSGAIDDKVKPIIIKTTEKDANCIDKIGFYFLKGKHGFQKDEANAFFLFSKAAAKNNPRSTKMVAKLYKEGIGTDKNLDQALVFCKKALKLYEDNEKEQEIIKSRIKKIENEMKNPDISDEASDVDDYESENDEVEKEEEEDQSDSVEEDPNKKECMISIQDLPNPIKKSDIIANFFEDYENINIEIKNYGIFRSADIYFQDENDKKKFCSWYHQQNKKAIKIKNKKITFKGIPKTKREILKDRKKLNKKLVGGSILGSSMTNVSAYMQMSNSMYKKQMNKSKKKKVQEAPKIKKKIIQQKKFPIKKVHDIKMTPEIQISLNDYYPGEEEEEGYDRIGYGSYSNVYKAYGKEDDILYAAKVFKNGLNDYKARKNFSREISSLISLDSPFIVKLYGYNDYSLIDPNVKNSTMIMEYMPNGTLEKIIVSDSKDEAPTFWDNTMKIKTIIGIARAMAYIHRKAIIHRDLKPDNIFFDSNYDVKIGDLGCSRFYDNQSEIIMTLNVGTPCYTAPEVLDDNNLRYSTQVDVYSFGIILYQLLTRQNVKQIFKEVGKKNSLVKFYKKIIDENYRPKIPDDADKNLANLIEKCWSYRIDDRPSFLFIFLMFKAIFENDPPPTTFFPDVDVHVIRKYLKKLDSYEY